MTTFPTVRMRRLRKLAGVRHMVRENSVTANDFIYPLFICPGSKVNKPIGSMPGVALLPNRAPIVGLRGVSEPKPGCSPMTHQARRHP